MSESMLDSLLKDLDHHDKLLTLRYYEDKVGEIIGVCAEPEDFVPYRNIAGLGLISLTITWIVFDIFAFIVEKAFIGTIAVVVTLILAALTAFLKLQEIRINIRKKAIYNEERDKYDEIQTLSEMSARTDDLLKKVKSQNFIDKNNGILHKDSDCPISDSYDTKKFLREVNMMLEQIEMDIDGS